MSINYFLILINYKKKIGGGSETCPINGNLVFRFFFADNHVDPWKKYRSIFPRLC